MTAPCRTFAGATECGIEWVQWLMADALVRPGDTVLELGARFGTTSCALAAATNNSGRVISVEPDAAVHAALLANRAAHRCRFHAVLGVVSSAAMAMVPKRSAELCDADGRSRAGRTGRARAAARLPSIAPDALQRALGLRIGVLLVDCEGCLRPLLEHDAALVRQARLLLLEEDGAASRREYDAWYDTLRSYGFRASGARASRIRWPGAPRHALGVVARPARRPPDCPSYARQRRLSRRELRCVTHVGRTPVPPLRWRRAVGGGRPRPPRSGHRKRPAGSRRRRTRRGRGRPPPPPSTGVRRPVPRALRRSCLPSRPFDARHADPGADEGAAQGPARNARRHRRDAVAAHAVGRRARVRALERAQSSSAARSTTSFAGVRGAGSGPGPSCSSWAWPRCATP